MLICTYTHRELARRIGRSERAVKRWCAKERICASKSCACWVPSGVAAEMTGYTQQYLTGLARQRRIRSHRMPGGQWWLLHTASLPLNPHRDND